MSADTPLSATRDFDADVEWLRKFLNCAVFSPPPSEIQRAQNVVTDILSALSTSRACTRERDERVQELTRSQSGECQHDFQYGKGSDFVPGASKVCVLCGMPENALPSFPAHTDHPLRHFDRTCPACVSQSEYFNVAPQESPGSISGEAQSRLTRSPAAAAPLSSTRPSENFNAFCKVIELIDSINAARYGKPIIAALHLCHDLADEVERLKATPSAIVERCKKCGAGPRPGEKKHGGCEWTECPYAADSVVSGG